MDGELAVLIVEDDPEASEAFLNYLSSVEDVCLVSITDDADKALECVKDFAPDVIILDLELHRGSGNGIAFLASLGKGSSDIAPYVVVTTHNTSRTTHEQSRQLGAT
ncbi:MAG: response regulator [Oscillospiraceae bacterium]|nr:response regulator [Oscillospiraceae bacterium]